VIVAQQGASLTTSELDPIQAAEERDAGSMSLRASLGVLWGSGSGRLGVILFGLLVLLSIFVAVSYPLDFGKAEWSNPVHWADNPKSVPPAWTTWFGSDAIEQQSARLTEPAEITQRGAAEVRSFPMQIDVPGGDGPTFLTMTLPGITYSDRPPVIIVTLLRPDGGEIRLANLTVRGPREGETAPFQRYYDVPERVVLNEQQTALDAIQQFYTQQYPGLPANDISTRLNLALFGAPASDGSGAIEVLPGTYTLTAQVLVADPNDEVASVNFDAGGTVFGWMGTDSLGRDLWRGLLYGFPVGLIIALITSLLSTIIGTAFGVVSGYYGGWVDAVIQRSVDIISNVPTLPLLIFLVFLLGSHLWLTMLVLVAFSWPGLTIVVRTMVLQVRSGQLVESAKALGASRRRIMVRHIFPQIAPYIVAQMIFFAPGAILAEASLSFLGLGDPSIPTWGQMLQQGFQTGALYVGYWWWVLPPGILIVLTAIVFMLLALGMEAVVDPRMRERR
jgi:peptide/nickel transport system permease protein